MLALLLLAPVLAGCGATASDIFSPDLLSKDAEWFSRSGRLFIKNVSIDTPPLTPDKPVTAEDLVSGDGVCPGMASANISDECQRVIGWRSRSCTGGHRHGGTRPHGM